MVNSVELLKNDERDFFFKTFFLCHKLSINIITKYTLFTELLDATVYIIQE